jgi:hypothetical protein
MKSNSDLDELGVVRESDLEEKLRNRRELSDQQVAEILKRITPVIRKNDTLYYIEATNPNNFTREPKLLGEAQDLIEHAKIVTLHGYGYHCTFEPSLREVLSQIPPDLLKEAKAFETIGPQCIGDFYRQHRAVHAGYHVALTILYF